MVESVTDDLPPDPYEPPLSPLGVPMVPRPPRLGPYPRAILVGGVTLLGLTALIGYGSVLLHLPIEGPPGRALDLIIVVGALTAGWRSFQRSRRRAADRRGVVRR